MSSLRLPLLAMIPAVCQIGWAQSPTYGVGKTPTAEEIRAWDISIGPLGKELPAGSGTAKQGAQLYAQKGCAGCHGKDGYGGPAPNLIKAPPGAPVHKAAAGMDGHMVPDTGIMALRSPFAVTIWDYIHRGMPLNKEGTLTADESYALTAFLLYKNGVIQSEEEALDAQSLPKVKMPNHDGFASEPEWKHGTPRLQGYP